MRGKKKKLIQNEKLKTDLQETFHYYYKYKGDKNILHWTDVLLYCKAVI